MSWWPPCWAPRSSASAPRPSSPWAATWPASATSIPVHRYRHPARGPHPGALPWHAGDGHQLLHLRGRGGARHPGLPGLHLPGRHHRSVELLVPRGLPAGHRGRSLLGTPSSSTSTRPTSPSPPRSGAQRPTLSVAGREAPPTGAPRHRRGEPVHICSAIRNSDLSVGARISGEIARRHGLEGLPPGTIELRLQGAPVRALAPGAPAACAWCWRVRLTTTWARACPAERSSCSRPRTPPSPGTRTSSWATPFFTAPPAAGCSPPAAPASASLCATAAPWP